MTQWQEQLERSATLAQEAEDQRHRDAECFALMREVCAEKEAEKTQMRWQRNDRILAAVLAVCVYGAIFFAVALFHGLLAK